MENQLSAEELQQWELAVAEANRTNVFCHCRNCDSEWVASAEDVPCDSCGSKNIQYILCWQFPDD